MSDNSKPIEDSLDSKLNDAALDATVDLDANTLTDEPTDIIIALEERINGLEEALALEKENVLRAVAASENVKKRAYNDSEKARKFALEKFCKDLLPVFDSLQKAMEFNEANLEALDSLLKGTEMTYSSLLSAGELNGLELINPKDAIFDPEKHQAISTLKLDTVESNVVVDVMQCGFLLNGRVLRPAMVIVSE